MINVKPLCQRDARWADAKLGHSDLTIGNYGCTITSLTMLYNLVTSRNLNPFDVNERLKANGGFVGAKLLWSGINRALPELKFTWRGYNYQNLRVAQYVYFKNLAVMVQVNPGKALAVLEHWCLYLGYQRMADPWDGKIKSTATYPATGYTLIDRK